ncbi:hypothetical protein C6W24_16680 [Bacillus atrophaeus]|nr:hypothetical protein C6W24_16680 [Bacillus atrophaeus]
MFSTSAVIFLKLSASCTSRFDALYFMWSADSSFSFRKTPEKQPPKKIRAYITTVKTRFFSQGILLEYKGQIWPKERMDAFVQPKHRDIEPND